MSSVLAELLMGGILVVDSIIEVFDDFVARFMTRKISGLL